MEHKDTWESAFDKKFPTADKPCGCCGGSVNGHWNGGIKSFIRDLLAAEREKARRTALEEVQAMVMKSCGVLTAYALVLELHKMKEDTGV